MIASVHILLLVAAVVLFAIATFVGLWIPTPRIQLMAAGLFCYALKDLFPSS